VLGCLGGEKIEEGLQRRQALIARGHLVVALLLEEGQELSDPRGGEVVQTQGTELDLTRAGDEQQEQPYGIPIALDGRRAHALLRLEVMLEEGVQQCPECDGAHGRRTPSRAGAAKRSKRMLASARSASVMVR
jgi:hypothetical protein